MAPGFACGAGARTIVVQPFTVAGPAILTLSILTRAITAGIPIRSMTLEIRIRMRTRLRRLRLRTATTAECNAISIN